jgi:hypothetical protein
MCHRVAISVRNSIVYVKTLSSLLVAIHTMEFYVQEFHCPQSAFRFCMVLSLHSDYFFTHYFSDFYKGD